MRVAFLEASAVVSDRFRKLRRKFHFRKRARVIRMYVRSFPGYVARLRKHHLKKQTDEADTSRSLAKFYIEEGTFRQGNVCN